MAIGGGSLGLIGVIVTLVLALTGGGGGSGSDVTDILNELNRLNHVETTGGAPDGSALAQCKTGADAERTEDAGSSAT